VNIVTIRCEIVLKVLNIFFQKNNLACSILLHYKASVSGNASVFLLIFKISYTAKTGPDNYTFSLISLLIITSAKERRL